MTIRPLQSAREITSVRKERDLHLTVRTIPDGAITLELVWSDPRSDSERAVKGSGRERTMGSLAKCLYADKEENRRRERGILQAADCPPIETSCHCSWSGWATTAPA